MKPADVGLAVMVAAIWGLAFVASRIALDEFSPALMTTLRFAIAALAVPVRAQPDVSWPILISISLRCFSASSWRKPMVLPMAFLSAYPA